MRPLAPGASFPAEPLPDLEGVGRPLGEAWAAGRAVVVVGHGECGTTRLALPYVERLARRRGPGAAVVVVLQEEPDAARELVAELGLTLPVRLDREPYALGVRLGLESVPSFFEMESGGRVLRVAQGFRRQDLEVLASDLGVPGPFFTPADRAPALRPG